MKYNHVLQGNQKATLFGPLNTALEFMETELQFTPFQEQCIELVNDSDSACRGRHSLRCAVNHLKKGWALRGIDDEMAVFRAITAEEEAVSGLFHALKFRGYKNSNRLKPHDHRHKSAAIPFLQILGFFFEEFSTLQGVEPKLHIKEEDGETRLRIALPMQYQGKELWAYPLPPLNFAISSDGKSPSFKPQIERFLTDKNSSDMLTYVRDQANLRNKVLYAGADGFPQITDVKDSFFELRRTRVMAMICGYLFIQPYGQRMPFVQNSLDAFLAMLKIVESEVLHAEL